MNNLVGYKLLLLDYLLTYNLNFVQTIDWPIHIKTILPNFL